MDEKTWREMFAAIQKREDNKVIKFLMDADLDVNTLKDEKGKTMLSYAAECGNLENIEYLVQKGADGNAKNSDGSIPLHIAAKYGSKDIVEFFLNLGIFVDSCDNKKNTPLHYAARGQRKSPAALESYQELIHFLVDSKADLNAVNQYGDTPLLLAAEESRAHIVELLIKLGADVKCCNKKQWTVLHQSSFQGMLEIVRTLVEGKFDIDLNVKNSQGHTPLSLATICSRKEVVKLLIESGADVKCQVLSNRTVLHFACRYGWFDLVKSLVVKGYDVNTKDSTGIPLVVLAAYQGHHSVVEYLIESGADINGCDSNEYTVFHFACRDGWLNIVKSIIKKGFNLDTPCVFRHTPLHLAVEGRNLKIIEHLLKAGADCNVENCWGVTAFTYFIRHHPCLEGAVLFLENGAYLQPKEYDSLSKITFLKEVVLQDVRLCTQAVVNQFNNADLPQLYKIPVLSERLPSIGKIKIANNGNVAQDIALCVEYEIQTKGCCNILNVRPGSLIILSTRSLIEHFVG